jgi:hypothetical protein
MKGSVFAQTYGSQGLAKWEEAAMALAHAGEIYPWSVSDVVMTDAMGRKLTISVTDDYFAIGEEGDVLRLPLTPKAAQRIADATGMLLPTTKMVREIHRQAVNKPAPHPLIPNNGAVMSQYVAHNAVIEELLAGKGGLTSGVKKDIVVGDAIKPGKVVIYGWGRQDNPPADDPHLYMDAPWRVQPYSSVHGDFYVDYSHGVRLVSPKASLDGIEVDLRDLLKDPTTANLASDEGVLLPEKMRYPAPQTAATKVPWYKTTSLRRRLVDLGRDTAIEHFNARKTG